MEEFYNPNEEKLNKRRENYADLLAKHRRLVVLRALIAIVGLILVVGIVRVVSSRKIYTDYNIKETYSRETATSGNTLLLGRNILSYSNDGVSCSDASGKIIWNETYEMQNPIVAIKGDTAAIGDYDGGKIYVVNASAPIGEITTNLPIRYIDVSNDGVVAATLDDGDVTWIYLYNAKGETIAYFKTSMNQSGYPLSVSISPNGNLVCVAYTLADTGRLKSSVAFFNFGEVGKNTQDHYMSGYDYDSAVVPYTGFMTSDVAFAVADNRLMFYEGGQKPVSKSEVLLDYEIQSVYYNETAVALISYDTTGEHKYRVQVYEPSGKLQMEQGFDVEYKNILLYKDNLYIYGDAELAIYNTSGVEKYAGTLEQDISMVIPSNTISRFSIVGKESIAQIQLN